MRTYVSSFPMNTLCESYSKARVCFLSLLIITRNISLARARDRSSLAFQLKLPSLPLSPLEARYSTGELYPNGNQKSMKNFPWINFEENGENTMSATCAESKYFFMTPPMRG